MLHIRLVVVPAVKVEGFHYSPVANDVREPARTMHRAAELCSGSKLNSNQTHTSQDSHNGFVGAAIRVVIWNTMVLGILSDPQTTPGLG